jgi:hypothetical protein
MKLTRTLVIWLITALALQPAEPFWNHFLGVADAGSGRLLLILLDADGDGRKEIFLAPSETCGNGGCAWYVYSPTPVPNQVRYLGEAGFSPGGYRFTRSTHTISACWHMSAADCALGEYRFQNGRMTRVSLGTCRSEDAGCQADLARTGRWQKEEAPPLLSADVPESGEMGKLAWHQARGSTASPATGMPDFNALVVAPRRE